jgi:sulfur-oxidizing protein SoxY
VSVDCVRVCPGGVLRDPRSRHGDRGSGLTRAGKQSQALSVGCSAPAAKNADEAIASLGQMKFRVFGKPTGGRAGIPHEAQIMIRHPNNSGLQRDQVSLLYIPANFVDELHVWQGEALLFSMKAGISISEDPNFRFTYVPNGATTFKVKARDTEGKVFHSEWPASAQEM